MSFEIERKFLVLNDDWRPLVARADRLEDGLVDWAGQGRVRVRVTGSGAKITLKGPRRGITRPEFEYDVPVDEAREMLRVLCDGHIVVKTRHYVPQDDVVWEVDVYHGALTGVVMAEVELTSEDQIVRKPSWIGAEITLDPAWRKSALVERAMAGRLEHVPAA